jgi:uncharacterized membrane protein
MLKKYSVRTSRKPQVKHGDELKQEYNLRLGGSEKIPELNRSENRGGYIWLLIGIFSVIYSVYTIVRHLRIETYIFDLGYYDQLIWLFAHGQKLFSSVIDNYPWLDHISPSIFLLAPLYWVWDNVIILLLFQSVFVCLGALPIYLLSLRKTKNVIFSLALAFCYLIFYGIENAVAFDFHAVTLGPTLLAFIFWFYETKKFKAFWVTLAIFVGLQENFFILAAALGVFIALKYKDYKRGIPIFIICLATAILIIFFIIPKEFGSGYYYAPTFLEKTNISTLFRMIYTPSSKIDVVLFSLLSFGFLPLLSPVFFILLGEEFLGRFLGTTNSNWWILGFHYNAILAPILAFAAISSVEKYFKKKEYLAVIFILIGTAISLYRVRPDIPKMFNKGYYDFSKTVFVKEAVKLIPDDASVAATNDLGAQISHRKTLIFFSDCVDENIGYDKKPCYQFKPGYYFINMDPNGSSNNYYPERTRDQVYNYINNLIFTGEYELIYQKGYINLLRRN